MLETISEVWDLISCVEGLTEFRQVVHKVEVPVHIKKVYEGMEV
jgi:hypothetical protein